MRPGTAAQGRGTSHAGQSRRGGRTLSALSDAPGRAEAAGAQDHSLVLRLAVPLPDAWLVQELCAGVFPPMSGWIGRRLHRSPWCRSSAPCWWPRCPRTGRGAFPARGRPQAQPQHAGREPNARASGRSNNVRPNSPTDRQPPAGCGPRARPTPKPFTLVLQIDAWNIRERDDWAKPRAAATGQEPTAGIGLHATCFRLEQRVRKGKRRA